MILKLICLLLALTLHHCGPVISLPDHRKHLDPHHFDFDQHPTSSYVTLDGKKYSFKCSAKPPTAEIRWLFNGQPINETLFAGYLKVFKNNLVVRLPKSDNIHLHNHNQSPRNHHRNHSQNSHHHNHNGRPLNLTGLNGGILQCLASYRNNAIISLGGRILFATLDPFHQSSTPVQTVSIPEGNTAVIPCSPPSSMPTVVTEFAFNASSPSDGLKTSLIDKSRGRHHLMPSGNLQISSVTTADSGTYRCISYNPYINQKRNNSQIVVLEVSDSCEKLSQSGTESSLGFLVKPKPQTNAILGTNVTLECVASGCPKPVVSWSKLGGQLLKHKHTYVGTNLVLLDVRRGHGGTYVCEASTPGGHRKLTARASVDIQEVPQITTVPQDAVLREGQDYRLECKAKGRPSPAITWFYNGNKIVAEDAMRGIRLTPDPTVVILENVDYYRHTGIYQCFATNKLESTYAFARINIVDGAPNPKLGHDYGMDNTPTLVDSEGVGGSGSGSGHNPDNVVTDESTLGANNGNKKRKKKNKGIKMVPPSKPEISRLSEHEVMVRWDVPQNDGLPILFFKVQYKEVGKTDWMTVDADIAPYIHSYALSNLKTGAKYKFRIAAVYQNNDNKSGPTSAKFTLLKDPPIAKPSSPPVIISASAVSYSSIEIKWDYFDADGGLTEGFFIYYQATHTVSDYLKITVEGLETRSHVITHLAANTAYDIKMQSFNVAGTSPFSNIYTNKTLKDPNVIYDNEGSHNDETNDVLQTFVPSASRNALTLYCIIGVVLGAVALMALIYISLCIFKSKNPTRVVGRNGVVVVPSGVAEMCLDKERKPPHPSMDHDFHMGSFHVLNNHHTLNSNHNHNNQSCNHHNGHAYSTHNKSTTNGFIRNTSLSEKSLNGFKVNHEDSNPLNSLNQIKVNPLCASTTGLNANGKLSSSLRAANSISHINLQKQNVATAERKKGKYVEEHYPTFMMSHSRNSINGKHHTSFTRLNGTLERKRKSRNDLTSNNGDVKEVEPMLPSSGIKPATVSSNGLRPPIIVMQSSC